MKDLIPFILFFFLTVLGVLMVLAGSPAGDFMIGLCVCFGIHQMWELDKDEV